MLRTSDILPVYLYATSDRPLCILQRDVTTVGGLHNFAHQRLRRHSRRRLYTHNRAHDEIPLHAAYNIVSIRSTRAEKRECYGTFTAIANAMLRTEPLTHTKSSTPQRVPFSVRFSPVGKCSSQISPSLSGCSSYAQQSF